MLTPFQWRMLTFFSLLFFAFSVSAVVLTLLLVYEVKDDTASVDPVKLRFVEVSNWIFASLVVISMFTGMGGGVTFRRMYHNISEKPVKLDLRPAQG
jgi:hypothetical protein